MHNRLVIQGTLTALIWLILVLPSIIGYIKGFSQTMFFHSYLFGQVPKTPLWDTLFLASVFILLFALYFWALKQPLKNISPVMIMFWTTVFTTLLLLLFPFACQDVYYYAATGQLQSQYQMNPYIISAHQIPDWRTDPLLSNTRWGFLVHVYGPLWAKVSHGLVTLSGNNLWPAVILFKVFAGLVHLINLFLVGIVARRLGTSPTWSMVAYGWNPLLLFELPGHAHNDALLLSFIILAVYFLTFAGGVLAIPSLILAAAIKYTSLLLIPIFVLWLILQRQFKSLLASGLMSLVILLIVWTTYWEGLITLDGLVRQMNFYSIKSMHSLLLKVTQTIFPEVSREVIFSALSSLLTLAFLLIYSYLLYHLYKEKPKIKDISRLLIFSMVTIILYLFIANKWFQPWYLAWVIPLAALSRPFEPTAITALLLSFSAEISRIPQMIYKNVIPSVQLATFVIAWLPLLYYWYSSRTTLK